MNTRWNPGSAWHPMSVGAMLVGLTVALTPGSAAGQTDAKVTFTKDVAPILPRSCQSCHRSGPGGGAPMSLRTCSEVHPWARASKDRTSQRTMPRWFIDKNVGVQGAQRQPIAEHRRNSDDRTLGGQRRAARQSGRHADAAGVPRRQGVDDRGAGLDRLVTRVHRQSGGVRLARLLGSVADRDGRGTGTSGGRSARSPSAGAQGQVERPRRILDGSPHGDHRERSRG